jgi:hypothetical protein
MSLYEDLVDFLFDGAMPPEELKKMDDASEVHVNRAVSSRRMSLKRKKREAEVGLANNAFGAGAGAVATKQAYDVARRMDAKKMSRTKTGRMLLKSKVDPKVAIPVVGAVGIGAQAANGLMDAQSAHYFRRELKDIHVKEDKIKKSVEWSGEISKVVDEKQQVFGWCSVSKIDGEDVIDRQGDFVPVDEMENSAYDYVLHSRKGGDMHARDGEHPIHKSDMIESFVVTPEKLAKMGLPEDALPHGWWVGFKVNDRDLWEEVKTGKKTHFSVHGKGTRVPLEV